MATNSFDDFDVTKDFANMVDTIGGIASAATILQNVSQANVAVVAQASGAAPSTKTGIILRHLDSIQVNAAQVWVRSIGAEAAKLSVTLA